MYNDILQKDNTWNIGLALGAEYRITGLFNPQKNEEKGQAYFSFSAGYIHGGKISYMNVEKDATAQSHHHQSNSTNNSDKTDYYTQWINTNTQIVHQHHTGYVYTSPIRMLELKIGFSIKF